jgi:hypothetical protein
VRRGEGAGCAVGRGPGRGAPRQWSACGVAEPTPARGRASSSPSAAAGRCCLRGGGRRRRWPSWPPRVPGAVPGAPARQSCPALRPPPPSRGRPPSAAAAAPRRASAGRRHPAGRPGPRRWRGGGVLAGAMRRGDRRRPPAAAAPAALRSSDTRARVLWRLCTSGRHPKHTRYAKHDPHPAPPARAPNTRTAAARDFGSSAPYALPERAPARPEAAGGRRGLLPAASFSALCGPPARQQRLG